jgi:uncharacterized membrane protein YhaH (DUF805 family)
MLSTLALLFFQETTNPEIPAGAAAGLGVMAIIYCALLLLVIAALWKIFTKAGKPGWAALIPIYNIIVLLEIAGKPAWWVILFLIPFVNFIVAIIVSIAVAKNFGKGTGFGVGLAFLGFIFGPILAFGDAQYNPQP